MADPWQQGRPFTGQALPSNYVPLLPNSAPASVVMSIGRENGDLTKADNSQKNPKTNRNVYSQKKVNRKGWEGFYKLGHALLGNVY